MNFWKTRARDQLVSYKLDLIWRTGVGHHQAREVFVGRQHQGGALHLAQRGRAEPRSRDFQRRYCLRSTRHPGLTIFQMLMSFLFFSLAVFEAIEK